MVKRLAIGLAIMASAAACKSHWSVEATQPALVLDAGKPARTSWPLTIVRRDMELRWMRLANTAYYVVVSRDRLRFHLTLRHKWETMSDLRSWDAWVEDGKGVRHELEQLDQHIEQVDFQWRGIGRGSVAMYRGVADFSIYARDLFEVGNKVTLVLRRPGCEYRYVWHSEMDVDS